MTNQKYQFKDKSTGKVYICNSLILAMRKKDKIELEYGAGCTTYPVPVKEEN